MNKIVTRYKNGKIIHDVHFSHWSREDSLNFILTDEIPKSSSKFVREFLEQWNDTVEPFNGSVTYPTPIKPKGGDAQ